MGGEPWDYFVPYEADIQAALQKSRQREFAAGRFRGSEDHPRTIEAAIENSEDQGTASILDMLSIGDEPDYSTVTPLLEEDLLRLFGTTQPTRAMIAGSDDMFHDIERGQGVYVIAYEDGQPSGIFFAGYSYD